MTDFIDNLLTSMSSKFNEQKEVGPINLSGDKTLKWRGLHNNQYAAVKKRRKPAINNNSAAAAADTPENGQAAAAGEPSGDKITAAAKETTPDAMAVDEATTVEEQKTNRRTLRRKLVDDVPEDNVKRTSRAKKQPATVTAATAAAVVADAPAIMQQSADKSSDDVNSADVKIPSRRSVRARKAPNTGDHSIHADQPQPTAEQNRPSAKVKIAENLPIETDTIADTQGAEQPKLRRSERTLHGSMSTETKDSADVADIKAEELQPTPAISNETSASDSLKKFRKKGADEKKPGVEEPKAIAIENIDDPPPPAVPIAIPSIPHTSQEVNANVANKITISGEPVQNDDQFKVKSPSESVTASDTEAKPMEIDSDLIGVDASDSYSPKKRGRKPITKFVPKNDPKESQPIATRSSKIKKSPRQISDESAFSYTLTKKDKTINEQVISIFLAWPWAKNESKFFFVFFFVICLAGSTPTTTLTSY